MDCWGHQIIQEGFELTKKFEINIKLEEDEKNEKEALACRKERRTLDDSTMCVYYGHRPRKKETAAHSAKTIETENREIVCQSVGQCIVCVYMSFNFIYSLL